MKKSLACSIATVLFLSLNTNAQNSEDTFWLPANESSIQLTGKRQIIPQKFLAFSLNGSNLKNKLFSAPHEKAASINQSTCIISLPLPNGILQKFKIVESPIMADDLGAAYPNIKTFSVKGIDDPYANGKLDWNEFGFHGMIRTVNGDFFIDPYCVGNIADYISYYTADFIKDPSQRITEGDLNGGEGQKKSAAVGQENSGAKITTAPVVCIGTQLRTYRLAIACTGEYAVAATGYTAPTVAQTLAKIVTSVNRVDGVYETEVDARLVLIATETLVVFTNANTDPFSGNNNASTLINESQTVITSTIGSANFDIGHTFSTGGGGLAYVGVVCSNSGKARGITGSSSPVGDPYDIDYVAHEMGHQFGGNHTFNAITGSCSGNRNASTATEPGSGVTIMAYAGICSPNDLSSHSIAYFHATSYDEIATYINSGYGNTCPVNTASGNHPPVVTGSAIFTIPKATPFTLTGSATDPDGDPLTYSWEETDPGSGAGDNWNSGNAPFFRSYPPVTSPTRLFPRSQAVLNGNFTGLIGEYLPQTAQTLTFRLTARDNVMGGGGVCYAKSSLIIDNSGPLNVSYPSANGIAWAISTQKTITWDVNGTDQAPVNCDSVRISISYDSGLTYSVIINSAPNNGSASITVPTLSATINTCRIKVESIGNVFYDISNNNFTISTNLSVGLKQISANNSLALTVWPNPFNSQVNFIANNLDSKSTTLATITDILGNTVMQYSYSSRSELKETLDLSALSNGIYFIKVSNGNSQSVHKLVKN